MGQFFSNRDCSSFASLTFSLSIFRKRPSPFPHFYLFVLQFLYFINAELLEPFNDDQSNYIHPIQQKVEYPQCMDSSVCAFLQVNDKGLSKVRYCTCGDRLRCPMIWDPYDGQSITQGLSDQYKYCEAAPKLKQCSRGEHEVAYTSYKKYKDDKVIFTEDILKCVCPAGHNYLDKKYNFNFEGEFETVTVSYFCLPLPTCNETQHCKAVTEKPNEYLVQAECLCPGKSICPTTSIHDKHNKAVETTWFNNVAIHKIGCQQRVTPFGWPLLTRWWERRKKGSGSRWWGPPVGMFSGAWR